MKSNCFSYSVHLFLLEENEGYPVLPNWSGLLWKVLAVSVPRNCLRQPQVLFYLQFFCVLVLQWMQLHARKKVLLWIVWHIWLFSSSCSTYFCSGIKITLVGFYFENIIFFYYAINYCISLNRKIIAFFLSFKIINKLAAGRILIIPFRHLSTGQWTIIWWWE